MKKPLFSVVVPLYNKERSVGRAVTSVLSQSIESFELIIVDDGSTDRGVEVVSSFTDSRTELIKQFNRGPSAARNRGVQSAQSDYICFLDADDEWDSDFLATITALMEVAPNAALFSVRYRVADQRGRIFHHSSKFPDAFFGYVDNFFQAYEFRGLLNSSSVCVRKGSLNAIGGFPEEAYRGEDIYTWLRLADMNQVAHANTEHVTIYRNAENRSWARVGSTIPFHIKAVLEGEAGEFSDDNRERVIRFVTKNAPGHAAGSVITGNRRIAFVIARMLWRFNHGHSSQAFFVAIMPRVILRILRRLRNSL